MTRPTPPPPPPRRPAAPAPSKPPAGPRAVANADAYTSLCDTFVAAQLRRGFSVDQLDRNGRLVTA